MNQKYAIASIHSVRAYVRLSVDSTSIHRFVSLHTSESFMWMCNREILQPLCKRMCVSVFVWVRLCCTLSVLMFMRVFLTCNSWYYWQLAGWRLLLLTLLLATDRENVCVSAIHLCAWYFLSNDKLCVKQNVFSYDIHGWRVRQNGHQCFWLSLSITVSLARSFHLSVIAFTLLFVIFCSFCIFMCVYIYFMSLCFIRIVWGHNRTNHRPHYITWQQKKPDRERQNKMRRKKKNFEIHL